VLKVAPGRTMVLLDVNGPTDTRGKDIVPFGVCSGCFKMKDLFFKCWKNGLLYCSEGCCIKSERKGE